MKCANVVRAAFMVSVVMLLLCSCIRTEVTSKLKGHDKARLQMGELEAEVMIPAPKAPYRGPRFSWAGIILQVSLSGHTFFGTLEDTLNPGQKVIGNAEEFGMYEPLGFDEVDVGEPFLRIGVGWLEKTKEEYRFWRPYKILKTFPYEIERKRDSITFVQRADVPSGFAYAYEKAIYLLKDNIIEVQDTLTNTGHKAIKVDQYSHNTFKFDGEDVGPGYELHLPFEPHIKGDLKGIAEVKDKSIVIRKKFGQEKAIFTELEGFDKAAQNNWALVYDRVKRMGVKIIGDFPLSRFNFYAEADGFCPEPYIDIHLEPGKSLTWRRTYIFGTDVSREAALTLEGSPER